MEITLDEITWEFLCVSYCDTVRGSFITVRILSINYWCQKWCTNLMELVNWIAEAEDEKMSREKSIFEQMGGTYTEIDDILYPNILIGEEETETKSGRNR